MPTTRDHEYLLECKNVIGVDDSLTVRLRGGPLETLESARSPGSL